MEKLDLERLARLVDETPNLGELEALEESETLRAELKALREQTEALGSLPDLRPPVGDWSALKTRLLSEGLLRDRSGADGRSGWMGGAMGSPIWMRAAAALILFLGGMWVGGSVGFGGSISADPNGVASGDGFPVGQVASAENREQAQRAVETAQSNYLAALVQYQSFVRQDSEFGSVDDSRKFLALENLIRANQQALELAPADPFINGMLVNAVAEREALLRTVSTSSSPGSWY